MTYALLWGVTAGVLATVLGYPLISYLRARNLGKAISADGPESHFSKAGTTTFGGILIFGVTIAVALIAAVPKDRDTLLPIIIAAIFAPIGFFDDLGTLVDRGKREAHERSTMLMKLAAFAIAGAGAAWILYDVIDAPRLLLPRYGHYDIGIVYVLIAVGVIVATTAAVGVTDGLDMLLGSTTAVAFTAYGAIALMQDQDGLATFSFVLVGALCGFLWHNAYPARIFMGDTGSLALGACLAVVALQTGWWLLLPIIGIVFVAEALSDVIQIGSYRLRAGKRVFRMAPIHHHFEKLDWPETRITARFLMIAVAGALVGLALVNLD